MYGDITEGWTKTVRRWAIFSWILLNCSDYSCGRWAYVELGWADIGHGILLKIHHLCLG